MSPMCCYISGLGHTRRPKASLLSVLIHGGNPPSRLSGADSRPKGPSPRLAPAPQDLQRWRGRPFSATIGPCRRCNDGGSPVDRDWPNL